MGDTEKSGEEKRPLFKEMDPENYFNRFDMKKLFKGIRRHIFLIIVSALGFSAIGGAVTYKFLTTYKAEAIVLFQDEGTKKIAGGYNLTRLSLATALDMIKIPHHLQAVRSILGLDLTPDALGGMTSVPTPKADSNLIRIVATSDNPNLAIDIANTLARLAVKSGQEFTQQQLLQSLESFNAQLEEAKKELALQNIEIENFKRSHQYFEMDAEYSHLLEQITELRQAEREATLVYNSILVEYENLRRQVATMPEQVAVSLEAQGSPMINRILSLQAALAEARSRFSKTNPKVVRLEEELKALTGKGEGFGGEQLYEKNSKKEDLEVELIRLQGKVRSAQKRKQELAYQMEEIEKELENLPAEQVAFAKILNAKELTDERIKNLTRSIEQTQLMLNVPKGSLEMYQLAERAKPVRESTTVKLLPFVSLIFGVGLGVCFAMFLEMFDSRLLTQKQTEIYYTLPCLAVIPYLGKLTPENLEEKSLYFIRNLAERLGREAPEFRVDFLNKKLGGKSLAVLSSASDEGKSFLAYQLADYYMKLKQKVALLEFDCRENGFSKPPASEKGALEGYLKGKATMDQAIRSVRGGPDILQVRSNEPMMKELIKSDKMGQLWEQLQKKYDLIILDIPGIAEEDYSVNAADIADASLFVAGAKVSNKKRIDRALIDLETFGVRPCGIVLNSIPPLYVDDPRITKELKRTKKKTK